jgi:predicted RNA-binding protein
MCLSSVYLEEADDGKAVLEEASAIHVNESGDVEIATLFGEKKILKGYAIVAVDFLKNTVVLREGRVRHE